MPDGELNFYSISEDGTVCNWLLMQSEMSKTIIVTLVLDIKPQITLGGISETLIGMLIIIFTQRTISFYILILLVYKKYIYIYI